MIKLRLEVAENTYNLHWQIHDWQLGVPRGDEDEVWGLETPVH